MLDALRAQLKQGKGKDGSNLSPRYSEDPYFKRPGAAARYAAWKHRLNPEAPFDVPDLFITGKTHDAIFGRMRGDAVFVGSAVPWYADVEVKYNYQAFGLNEESKDVYRIVLMPEAVRRIKQITGVK